MAISDAVLHKYDKNGDGKLQTTELHRLLVDAFPESEVTEVDTKSLLDYIDFDHDGTISVNELRALLRCYNPASHRIARRTALVIIDVQNDFISGALKNPFNAHEIVPVINGIRDRFDVVVISQDWHPLAHCSFVESVNEGLIPHNENCKQRSPFTQVTLKGDADRPEHTQTLYPRHAVQNSEGAKNHADLVVKDSDKKIYKGVRTNIDSYSAFFDNMKANDTGLTAVLERERVTDVYCCGLVFDICVMSSALHGAEMGFKTSVIEDACRPFFTDKIRDTKKTLARAGVSVISSAAAPTQFSHEQLLLKEFLREVGEHKAAVEVHVDVEPTTCSHHLMIR